MRTRQAFCPDPAACRTDNLIDRNDNLIDDTGRLHAVCFGMAVFVLLFVAVGATGAQQYPNRPIRLLVPYAPGGSSDAIGRILGQKISDALGQTLVIDNRPGAASMIGRELVAKAAPNGYTLMIGDAVHTINVHVLRNVPYHPINDLLGAQIQVAFPSLPPTVAHVRAGRLRVLAVAAEKRASVLPEASTFGESGVSGVVVSNWFGLMGPAKLPATIVSRLHAEVGKAVQAPDIREKFSAMALEIVANTPAEFKAMVETELVRWGQVVKQAGIRPE